MNAMTGQLDALELLRLTCQGCGQSSSTEWAHHNDHTIMPIDTRRAGFPVCVGMNLTLNHARYAIGQLGVSPRDYAPIQCFGRNISKPKTVQVINLAHELVDRAQQRWGSHADYATQQLMGDALRWKIPLSTIWPDIASEEDALELRKEGG